MGGDSKDCIEGICLSTRLCSLGISSSSCCLAGILGSLIGTAAVGKRIAYELGDNIDVLSGTMIE